MITRHLLGNKKCFEAIPKMGKEFKAMGALSKMQSGSSLQGGLFRQFGYGNLLKPKLLSKEQVLLDENLREGKHNLKKLHPKSRAYRAQLTQPLKPLTYKLHPKPENIDYFNQLGLQEELPFHVGRTKSGNLPVYRRYKQNRNIKRTEIRLITGDVEVRNLT